jgi:hypothetical protein
MMEALSSNSSPEVLGLQRIENEHSEKKNWKVKLSVIFKQ